MPTRDGSGQIGAGVSGEGRVAGRWATGRGPVIGREAEVAVLADFLGGGRDTPAALVLDGEAGIGKTTLFEAAVAEAREQGFAVFSCRPAGAETAFSFAALADLAEAGAAGGARAVAGAAASGAVGGAAAGGGRGVGAGRAGDRVRGVPAARGAAAAGRCWLRSTTCSGSMRRPPPCSRSRFVGLRRRRSRFSSHAAASGSEAAPLGLDRALPSERLRRLRLGPLSVGATHRLLRERLGVSFPRPTLVQLHDTSGGNPFYALELGRALEQSGGRTGAGERLTIPTSLTELVSARLAALPEEVREVLEPVALLSEPTVSIVEAVASDTATVLERLRAAEAAAILELDERARSFQPPPAGRAGRGGARPSPAAIAPSPPRGAGRRPRAARPAPCARRGRAVGQGRRRAGDRLRDRGLAWRVGGGRGAGRALGLAHAGRLPATAFAAAASCSRPTITTRAATWSDRVRSSSRSLEQLPPGAERAEVLRRLGEASADDFERSERLLEQAFVEAEPDPRLRAEIVIPRVLTAFLRHGPAAAVKLARDSAQVVEESGDLVLLAAVPGAAQPRGALRGGRDARGARACARARGAGRAASDARPRRRSSRGCG